MIQNCDHLVPNGTENWMLGTRDQFSQKSQKLFGPGKPKGWEVYVPKTLFMKRTSVHIKQNSPVIITFEFCYGFLGAKTWWDLWETDPRPWLCERLINHYPVERVVCFVKTLYSAFHKTFDKQFPKFVWNSRSSLQTWQFLYVLVNQIMNLEMKLWISLQTLLKLTSSLREKFKSYGEIVLEFH